MVAGIAVACFGLQLMLDRPDPPRESRQLAVAAGDRRANVETPPSEKSGRPAVSGKREAAGSSRTGSYGTTQRSYAQPTVGKEASPGFQMSDEEDGIEDETSDRQDLEEQRLEEQIAESLRNPAYLAEAPPESGEPFEAEEISDDVADWQDDSFAEPPSEEELAVGEIEEDSQAEDETYTSAVEESAPELEYAAERALMTESGILSDDEPPDFNDIEEQTLNAQMEESLRNPAYLQSFTEEAPPGESSGGN